MQVVDCENLREIIALTKKNKAIFDESIVGSPESWDLDLLRVQKENLERNNIDVLKRESRLIRDYKFLIGVIMKHADGPKTYDKVKKLVIIDHRNNPTTGERMATIVVSETFLNPKREKNLDEKMPANLSIMGNLFLQRADISRLPKGLIVAGNLHINGTKIKKLPDDMLVHGDIYLDESLREEVVRLRKASRILGNIHLMK